MKRTLLALLVGLSLLLSLAACGSERASAQEVTEQGLAALRDLDVLALPQYWNTDGLNLDDLGDLTQAGEEVDLSAEDTAALEQGIGVYLVTDCLLNPKGRDISGVPQGTFAAFLEFAGV